MNEFNLSEWALKHRSLIWYFMIVSAVAGLFSYLNLGRAEDPDFTIKTMIVQANWPGATVDEMTTQVADRIEKKFEQLPGFDYTKSQNTAGSSLIYVNLKPTITGTAVPAAWTRARQILDDIKGELPSGVLGPFYNDDFGDVFGNVYAFTSDGLTTRQLSDYVETVRATVLSIPNVGKVELFGTQDEAIYLEFSTRRTAALGITQQLIVDALKAQNAITPSGVIEAKGERISVRVSGGFTSEDSLKNINLRIYDRFFRLSDVATIKRDYVNPPKTAFTFNGKPAIGLQIGIRKRANITVFGAALKNEMKKIEGGLPIGVGVHLVSDQPELVVEAVRGFVTALVEAVAIVLVVSFIALGLRAGLVVAISIPLVLAITFVGMELQGISLQRISLGALIIALGLLVDDAMIAIEMMVARLERGDPLEKAATYVYTHTAFPMLTGTLVTIASFFPIGLNDSSAGEFTYTLFVVIAVALIVSWVVAVLFVPLLGVTILPKAMESSHANPGWFTRSFSTVLKVCVRWKWLTIAATVAMFAVSVYATRFVEQQFFPSSDRKELLIDWTEPQNSSILTTVAQLKKFEQVALVGNDDIEHWTTYAGRGAVRFMLSFDVQPQSPNYGQIVIVAKDIEGRNRLRTKLDAIARRDFVGSDIFVHLLDIGPPVGRPIQYRISGPDVQGVRREALKLAGLISKDKNLGDIVFDWNEPARVVHVNVLQDKAAQLGVTSESISTALNSVVGGSVVTKIRDSIYLVDVIGRAQDADRSSIDTLHNLQIITNSGKAVPLAAIANIAYGFEQPIVWRRNRLATITVKASIVGKVQPATIDRRLEADVLLLQKSLPTGYSIATGGSVEESGKSQGPIVLAVPIMLIVMATVLMVQLQSFQRLLLVVVVAPLGLIGVVISLLLGDAPLGFVAILGVLALIGILIRNSVILLVQIEELRAEGRDGWTAVVEATQHRMRPILLTAAAASLALIPIAGEIFWGPMAFAMMGGIISGTVLTLLFLPALYIAWFRLKEPEPNAAAKVL